MTAAVITGASRGIGRATAVALRARGVDLALLARPSPTLETTCRALGAEGAGRLEVYPCDLTDPSAIVRAASEVLAAFGAPDVLVHNAGTIRRALVEETTLAEWEEQLSVNLRAPFLLTRSFLGPMKRAGRGRILHVASISSTLGTRRAAAYCASKWGLVGLMKSLAEEISDTGLMTLALLPGSVDTRMLEGSGFEPRMRAEDVARTLVYYALDAPLAHNGAIVEMFGT